MKFMKRIGVLLILISQTALAAETGNGSISGFIGDKETGEPVISANVYFDGTSYGAASDLDGKYFIPNIPVRSDYTLIVSVVGYVETKITDVEVKAGKNLTLDITLQPEILSGETVVVEAKALKNTEASLLKERQKAISVSDAVSAEAMSRAGSGNAAEAMRQVTGTSIVDNKYVFIRGLGDRYTSTNLNGAEIPGTDPYKRSAQIDLIPSNLIDNIVTIKSFTPDKPGDFSGGAVDIRTKDFPDRLDVHVSMAAEYNPQVSFNHDGPIGYTSSSSDWMGMDDGSREIPDPLKSDNVYIPDAGAARQDLQTAKTLDRYSKAFNSEFTPHAVSPGLNQSYAVSAGNQISLFKRPLGFLASLSYGRNFSSYDDGILRRAELNAPDAPGLVYDYNLKDSFSNDEVLWGTLLKTSYKITSFNKISFNVIYNQNGESSARSLAGQYPYDLGEKDVFYASVLSYKERNLKSYQIEGEHIFEGLNQLRLSWQTSLSSSSQDEPDLRYFSSFKRSTDRYGVKTNLPPSRYFRYLDEDRKQASLDLSMPFRNWTGSKGSVKIGGYMQQKERNYRERLFEFAEDPAYYYPDGNPDSLFGPENVGLIDTQKVTIRGTDYTSYVFGLYIRETYNPASTYTGDQNINAYYAMMDLPLTDRVRFIGGARYEITDMNLVTKNKSLAQGDLFNKDILPSVNLIYIIIPDMNLRASYGKTLARPTFREIAPYGSFDFMGGDTYLGYANLKQTSIDNLDLRWEWFSRPGEIYAVSGFWKTFDKPIERVFNRFGENTWRNVDQARVYGVEFELRKRLDAVTPHLSNFLLGSNFSLVNSWVDIDKEELALIRTNRPDAKDKRPLQGQSPFLFNVSFTYEKIGSGIAASLYYNVFGDRLYKVSLAGTPDVYEKPQNLLNFTFSWAFSAHLNMKFTASNLLNAYATQYNTYKDVEYIWAQSRQGRTYKLGLGYKL